jgi:membrane-associated phospholipid phosphatase
VNGRLDDHSSARLSILDRWSLAYAALASVVILVRWSGRLSEARTILGLHAALAACALLGARARQSGPIRRFIGEFYAFLTLIALYGSIGAVNLAAGVSYDHYVQGWEDAVFGGQPSCQWIRAWPWVWLSDILHTAYLSYYFILAAAPVGLWLAGRRVEARRTALVTVVAFYFCYVVFLAFPVAGPRYTFEHASNAATLVAPAVLTQRLLNKAAAWGTAFPSSHVAAALAASVSAWQGWRALGGPLVALSLLLSLGTVYGQLHYALDAVVGAAAGALAVALHPPQESR